MRHASILIALSAASLIACGKTDEAPAPTTAPQQAEAPPAETAPPAAAPTPLPEQVASPTPDTPPVPPTEQAAPAAPQPQPAPSEPSAPAAPAPASPAATEPKATTPASPPVELAHGAQIYRKACAFCHDKGAAGAPKLGDQTAWAPRITQGMAVLYTSSLRGKGAMPAKGGNPSLSEADVKAATDFLVAQSR